MAPAAPLAMAGGCHVLRQAHRALSMPCASLVSPSPPSALLGVPRRAASRQLRRASTQGAAAAAAPSSPAPTSATPAGETRGPFGSHYTEEDYRRELTLLSPAHWEAIGKVVAESGVAAEKVTESVHVGRALEDAGVSEEELRALRYAVCGASTPAHRALVDRWRGIQSRKVGELWVPRIWAFPETDAMAGALPAQPAEVAEAFAYSQREGDAASRRWGLYAACTPDLVLVDRDDSFKEAQAMLSELQGELLAEGGPDPDVFSPALLQAASRRAAEHPAHALHLAHLVYFNRRSKCERQRLQDLLAEKRAREERKARAAGA